MTTMYPYFGRSANQVKKIETVFREFRAGEGTEIYLVNELAIQNPNAQIDSP